MMTYFTIVGVDGVEESSTHVVELMGRNNRRHEETSSEAQSYIFLKIDPLICARHSVSMDSILRALK